jgi:HSP20 family protein
MNATIEETIERVERLYMKLTGARPQSTSQRTSIPPEADPIAHVQEQLTHMLSLVEQVVPRATPGWSPPAITWLEDKELVFAIDVPGVVASALQVRVTSTTLVVSGHRKPPWANAPRGIACDVALGAFERSFPLPGPVAAEQVTAQLDAGVLTIRCPRAAGVEQKISIGS